MIPKAIEISGKVVEEVGFDKIRKQLAELEELRIVLLDGLRISGVLSSHEQPEDAVREAAPQIAATCPKIIELDLSRSLLGSWRDVWEICNQLKQLKRLRVKCVLSGSFYSRIPNYEHVYTDASVVEIDSDH